MRSFQLVLVILSILIFSCQKTEDDNTSEPFYDRCILTNIESSSAGNHFKINYDYFISGKLKLKLYKDLTSGQYTAMDTIYYLPDSTIGRIDYREINRSVPPHTFSYTYEENKITKVLKTTIHNSIPFITSYDYSYIENRLSSITKAGDLLGTNYSMFNFIYDGNNIKNCELLFENTSDTIRLNFTTDSNYNNSKNLLPYPDHILLRHCSNNIITISNENSFSLNGSFYTKNTQLYKQNLIFNAEGAITFSSTNAVDNLIIETNNELKKFNYSCN